MTTNHIPELEWAAISDATSPKCMSKLSGRVHLAADRDLRASYVASGLYLAADRLLLHAGFDYPLAALERV